MTPGPAHITRQPEPPAGAAAAAWALAPVEAGSGSDAEASKGKRDLWTPDVRSNQPFRTGECTGNLLPPYLPIHIYCLNDHFCIFQSRCNGNSLVTDKCLLDMLLEDQAAKKTTMHCAHCKNWLLTLFLFIWLKRWLRFLFFPFLFF